MKVFLLQDRHTGRGRGSWTTESLAGTQSAESQIALSGSPAAPALQCQSLFYGSGQIPLPKELPASLVGRLVGVTTGAGPPGSSGVEGNLRLGRFRKVSPWFELYVHLTVVSGSRCNLVLPQSCREFGASPELQQRESVPSVQSC